VELPDAINMKLAWNKSHVVFNQHTAILVW
jgi:hypothetical protein